MARFSIRSLLVVITLISCATVAAVWLLSTYFGASASGVTAEAANRKLWSSLKLPDSASDVTYAVDSGGCEAEFAISESDFVNWCASNNWEIEKIAAPTIYFEPIILGLDEKTARIIETGYSYHPPDGEGKFDASSLRANFWVSTFP